MADLDFPPFIPAKPKGGVAAEIAATKSMELPVESEQPVKRKRRTREEMAAANGGEPRKRKKAKPAAMVSVDVLVAFAGLKADEIEQVINTCEAINTFPKAARKRIAAAIGQLFS